jgi:hypothetical protein
MMTKEELKAPMKKLIIVFPAMMTLGIRIGFVANNSPKISPSMNCNRNVPRVPKIL